MGTLQIPLCGLRNVQSPWELRGAARDSSPVASRAAVLTRVVARTSGFLSSADMDLGVTLEFPQGIQA